MMSEGQKLKNDGGGGTARWSVGELVPTAGGERKDYNLNMDSLASRGDPHQPDVGLDLLRPIPNSSESEHMMLVSPSFEILMLHPAFEEVWHRPASTFLGKKCYREIEKRDEPCPYCPGVVALRTGTAAEAEACAILDDGTRVPFMLRAFPIYGSDGEAAGFVENCENIAVRRQAEDDARSEANLTSEVLVTSSPSRVLTLVLDAALRLEGVESGYVVSIDAASATRELVAQRGLAPAEIETGASLVDEAAVPVPGEKGLLVRVPIVCNGKTAAELAVRVSGGGRTWSSTQTRLQALASVAACALVRIKAERLRGDAGVNIETLFAAIPLPSLFLDKKGKVTAWNEEAELSFGWRRREALGRMPLFLAPEEQEAFLARLAEAGDTTRARDFSFRCVYADGSEHDVSFRAAQVLDVLGDGSSYLLIASEPAREATMLAHPRRSHPGNALPAARTTGSGQTHEEQALAAAQALGQLCRKISQGLSGGDHDREGECPAANGGRQAGKMSLSWSDDGELDIRFSPVSAAGRGPRGPGSSRALVIQADPENAARLESLLHELGCAATVCTSVPAGLARLATDGGCGEVPDFAIVEMVMKDGPGGIETAKLLRAVDPALKVVVSSDHGIVGHTSHGFAAALTRPYTAEAVKTAMEQAGGRPTG